MADEPNNPPTIDPDNVPEILCDGRFNVHVTGALAYLTFTHVRPSASALIDKGVFELASVVRARIAMSHANIVAMRDLLNRIIQENPPPKPTVN